MRYPDSVRGGNYILFRSSIDRSSKSRILLSKFVDFFSFRKMRSKSAVFSHQFSNRDRMGSKLQFETSVQRTSKRRKTSATSRILIYHPVQVLWGFENGENISPNPVLRCLLATIRSVAMIDTLTIMWNICNSGMMNAALRSG